MSSTTTTTIILLTLLPTAPRDAGDFNNDLSDINIDVWDLTVKDGTKGIYLGSASGVTTAPYFSPLEIVSGTAPHPDKLKTPIIQHFVKEPILPGPLIPTPPPLPRFKGIPKSVATAVIVVDIDPSAPDYEFDSFDLRIVLSRGSGRPIGKDRLEYNVPTRTITGDLPVDPKTYIDFDYNLNADPQKTDPVFRAGYIFIPPKPKATSTKPTVPIGADGMTPVFDDLIKAVNVVLAADHSTTPPGQRTSLQERQNQLTASECLQVARELIYDKTIVPLPKPQKKSLEDMYGDPNVSAQDDQDRKQFEANLTGYHSQHDAEAQQLANYIFAASAAITCERLSLSAKSARLTFDITVHGIDRANPFPTASVLLNGKANPPANPNGNLDPTFGVPAAFFYALGTTLPSTLKPEDRYRSATMITEDAVIKSLQAAGDAGILNSTESALTTSDSVVQGLVIDQVARRLSALGATSGLVSSITLDDNISSLVKDWLMYTGKTEDIAVFWAGESTSQKGQYLDLLLDVIVAEKQDLKLEIINTLHVNSAADLPVIADKEWKDFFVPDAHAKLLPDYTLPGNTTQRVEAFIRFIKTLFSVQPSTVDPKIQAANIVPTLSREGLDCIQLFLNAKPGFSFANALNDTTIPTTVSTLAIDQRSKEWTTDAINVIGFLCKVTTFQPPITGTDTLKLSLMEALYARGFITPNRVALLSQTQFNAALAGTVAFRKDISDAIHKLATPLANMHATLDPEPGDSFTPINPGELVDCTPPPNLSPLGQVKYLKEMLELKVASGPKEALLLDVLASRRGPVGNLKASLVNTEICLPLIDLANESLEYLVSALSAKPSSLHGAVFDVDTTTLTNFPLGDQKGQLEPPRALIAIPQYSSPTTTATSIAVYETLQKDFSSPLLPYSQELDLNRTFLSSAGTSRFDIMRMHRKDITEFAIDPIREPNEFQRSLWRFPIRLEIAIEYLCISPDERLTLFESPLDEKVLAQFFGFSPSEEMWTSRLCYLPVFMERTGLSYCEVYQLWKSKFANVQIVTQGIEGSWVAVDLPVCEPCCLKSFRFRFVEGDESSYPVIWKLAIFIRLWRKLEQCYGKGHITFTVLKNICEVLHLFNGNQINPDFIRQIIAMFMLSDIFCVPVCDNLVPQGADEEDTPPEYVKILALWTDPQSSLNAWHSAIDALLDGVAGHAERHRHCAPRSAEFKVTLKENLESLSELVGFTQGCAWNAKPTCTLRFAEILSKIYASHFTIGEILYLFTEVHLVGDDPFPYTEGDESIEDPLNVPEDSGYNLWKLREELRHVSVDEHEIKHWTWPRIESSLRRDFGVVPSSDPSIDDPVLAVGEHFFPSILDSCGHPVPTINRQFRTELKPDDTSILTWESPPNEPFHYSSSTGELWTQLPLRDQDVLEKLACVRQLRQSGTKGPGEVQAVQELYFQPRAMLAPFTLIFSSLSEAIDKMVQEANEEQRFRYFQSCFALFHKRCKTIANHIAKHVGLVAECCADRPLRHCEADLAWRILQSLIADENMPRESWEKDSGESPVQSAFLWNPKFSGGAFAALLGLIGTGLLGKFTLSKERHVWNEIRGPMKAFGDALDENNTPIPTIIPDLSVSPTPQQQSLVTFRNGFALSDLTAKNLGGAQPFNVKWEGSLLVEKTGRYRFKIHRPHCFKRENHDNPEDHHNTDHHESCPACNSTHHEQHREDIGGRERREGREERLHNGDRYEHSHGCSKHCDEAQWLVKLRRGQKTWTLLSHKWPSHHSAPEHESVPICLSHGAYDIEVHFSQPNPNFSNSKSLERMHTGVSLKYSGPDTESHMIDIPFDKLFVKSKDDTLDPSVEAPDSSMHRFLKIQYVSSLRDIRRTYQRAFKAVLLAHTFRLSAEGNKYCQGESEIGFMLNHPANFRGTSYRPVIASVASQGNKHTDAVHRTAPSGNYNPHHANFDFNFLPIQDAYMPLGNADDRQSPSPYRISAVFDWWERLFDYKQLSHEVDAHIRENHHRGPVWRLFYEAAVQQPSDCITLLRHLGVDMSVAPLTLRYFSDFIANVGNLEDERWTIRVWHAWGEIQKVKKALFSESYIQARPDLWASDLPNQVVNTDLMPPLSGNNNLTYFVRKSLLLDRNIPDFDKVKVLDDCLRLRANKALIAYLCSMGRVTLSFTSDGETARSARDLSSLLLQEVDVGLCERSTRIQEAISAVHTFVQRVRLGLEPSYRLDAGFYQRWESDYSSFEKWKNYARRVVYSENWIQWEELQAARKTEAFKFLEPNLDRHTATMPVSSPPFSLSLDGKLPSDSHLAVIQSRDFGMLSKGTNSFDEGISLLGIPARDARPSWLSSTLISTDPVPCGTGSQDGGSVEGPPVKRLLPAPEDQVSIPLWFQAAVRLGTTFVRIAAAGLPPAMWSSSKDRGDDSDDHFQCRSAKELAPVIDEYYFWFEKSSYFDNDQAPQNADVGVVPPDPTTDWERPSTLPSMLHWPSKDLVHLNWTKVHLGTFSPPRRSAEGVPIDSPTIPALNFIGRKADSLVFDSINSIGQSFRYDIATDDAVITPQVVEDQFSNQTYPAPLPAYPYFIYFKPGAPLNPTSSFGMAISFAGSLRSQCKFDDALTWCKSVFDPLQRENSWPQCRHLKFRETAATPGQLADRAKVRDALPKEDGPGSTQEIDDGPCCPTSSVGASVARARAVGLEYIQTLLDWADVLMCRDTIDSTKQALVLLDEALRILGPKPVKICSQMKKAGNEMTVAKFQPAEAPLNPRLIGLYENAYDRREGLQHCLNSKRLQTYPTSIERPVCGLEASLSSKSLLPPCPCNCAREQCCPSYRFIVLLPKALELANTAKSLGSSLLSAFEKGDSEYLAALRETHERQLNQLMLSIKQNAYREADWSEQALGKQLEGAQTRLRYFQTLLKNGLNTGETAYISATNSALAERTAGNISEGIGQSMAFVPDITIGGAGFGGSPVAINQLPLGTKLAGIFQAAARIVNTIADISGTNANLSNTTGGWSRRADDWQNQVDVTTVEIAQIKRQQLAALRRRDASLRELNNHQEQIQHSIEVDDFMRDKLSKHDLYLFLQQENAALYRRTYDLAYQTALEAQAAFQHERRDLNLELPLRSWDNLYEGLMAGEKLEFSLRAMESLYMRSNCREYELTKHISLKVHFPLAFLQLKMLGWCEFELREWMFDLDYPGQYMRRIKSVSATIPLVVGPYIGVHCRIQLLSSSIRIDPSIPLATRCCCKGPCTDAEACGYDDYRNLSLQYPVSEAITTSSGQNDSGLFELNFRDERLIPFEFSGAVSRWRIELPPENNQFDLDTLTDFILHVNYSAREGGEMLRRAANKSAQRHLPGDGIRFLDVRHELPSAWSAFVGPRYAQMHSGPEHDLGACLPLQFNRRTFPFLTGRRGVLISHVQLFVELKCSCDVGEHVAVDYLPEGGCRDDTRTFFCTSSSPSSCSDGCGGHGSSGKCRDNGAPDGFYHAVLGNLSLGPLLDDETHTFGHLKFHNAETIRKAGISQVYFLCYYEAVERKGRCR